MEGGDGEDGGVGGGDDNEKDLQVVPWSKVWRRKAPSWSGSGQRWNSPEIWKVAMVRMVVLEVEMMMRKILKLYLGRRFGEGKHLLGQARVRGGIHLKFGRWRW